MTESNNGSALPSYSNSIRTTTAAQAYVRVRRVIALHWRGIVIVLLILVNVIFFSIIFVYFDTMTQRPIRDLPEGEKWVTCLVMSLGDKNKCLDLAEKVVLSRTTVMAVLIMQSVRFILPPHKPCLAPANLASPRSTASGASSSSAAGPWSAAGSTGSEPASAQKKSSSASTPGASRATNRAHTRCSSRRPSPRSSLPSPP